MHFMNWAIEIASCYTNIFQRIFNIISACNIFLETKNSEEEKKLFYKVKNDIQK